MASFRWGFQEMANALQHSGALQIAVEASKSRMRAIAFKDHWNLTAGAAYLVQRQVDEMAADGRLETPG